MEAKPDQIYPLAVLVRDPEIKGNFKLVIRWLLGGGDELPRHDDEFRVLIKLTSKNKKQNEEENGPTPPPLFLSADGSETEEETRISVKPQNHVMIEPPRRLVEVDKSATGEPQYQDRSLEPIGPVDPSGFVAQMV